MFGAVGLDGQQQTEQETFADLLTGTDFFISATTEPDVNRQLDLAALRMSVPHLFLRSQSGYGGIVALLRAGETGCFHCLSLYLSRKSRDGQLLVEVPLDDENHQQPGTIQEPGCGDKSFTATTPTLQPPPPPDNQPPSCSFFDSVTTAPLASMLSGSSPQGGLSHSMSVSSPNGTRSLNPGPDTVPFMPSAVPDD